MQSHAKGGDKIGASAKIHNELISIFRGILNENGALANENANLVSQVNGLVEVVTGF